MIDNNDFLPDAVRWSEGMLLSPQHFQQHDIQTQALVHQRIHGVSPHAWGLRTLRVDPVLLAQGVVRLTACDAVLPDGLPLVFRAEAVKYKLEVDIKQKCKMANGPVKVFLTVPPRAAAAEWPTTSIHRYEPVDGRPTMDESIGTGDVVVERQRARFELYADGDVPAGFQRLALLEVTLDSRGAVVLTPYHPPLLRVAASGFLGERGVEQRFAQLRTAMWDKLRQLIGLDADDAPENEGMVSAQGRMHLRAAREIAACLPLVDTVLCDPFTPMPQAWWAMAQIVGRMSALGTNPRPLSMDPYRHEHCQPQFDAALKFIDKKLAMVKVDWDVMEFERIADGQFSRQLPQDSGDTVHIELRPREGQTAAELAAWLADARIASEDLMIELRKRRIPGARAFAVGPTQAAGLGLRPDAMLFALKNAELDIDDKPMPMFRHGRALVVHGDPAHAPAAIVLHYNRRGEIPGMGPTHA